MKSKILFLFLVGLIFLSCEKKEKSIFEEDTTLKENITEPRKEGSHVRMLVESETPMQLSLYYASPGDESYAEDRRINVNHTGGGVEVVDFELKTDELPIKLMLDFNTDKLTKGARLRGLEVENKSYNFSFEDNDLASIFNFSENIKSKQSGIYEFVEIDGKFNPYLQSTPFYTKRVELESKK